MKDQVRHQRYRARIVPFDSPFVLRFSKDERRLRTGFGYVPRRVGAPADRLWQARRLPYISRKPLDPKRNACLPVGRGFVAITLNHFSSFEGDVAVMKNYLENKHAQSLPLPAVPARRSATFRHAGVGEDGGERGMSRTADSYGNIRYMSLRWAMRSQMMRLFRLSTLIPIR
jgi:hypothetical protein